MKITEKHTGGGATCTEAGTCSFCGASYSLSHDWGGWQAQNLIHFRLCSSCGEVDTDGHSGGGATCTTEGTCTDCGAFYKDPDNHEYVWTDHGDGTHTGQCRTHSDATITESHSWGNWSSSEDGKQHIGSCVCGATTSGYHAGGNAFCTQTATCEICKLPYQGTIHAWASWQSENNRHVRTCWYCGERDSGEHTGGSPTCTTSATCRICKLPYTNPDKHESTSTTTYAKTSETQHTPTMTYNCCGQSVEGSPVAHMETTAATCAKAAYCDVCGSSYGDPDPNAHVGTTTTRYVKSSETQHTAKITYADCGHTVDGAITDHTQTTAATCTASAYCGVCRSSYGSTNPSAHNLVNHDAKAPTCTTIGWNAYQTCSRCDYSTYVEKKALGHALVNHAAKTPTCTAIGWDAYQTCSRCDYSTYVEIPALKHKLVNHAAQAPTCTEIGWDAYQTCSRCSYSTYVEIPALKHKLVNHAAQAPTCTEIGWDAYDTCARCSYSTYVEKKALGHALVNHAAKAPTCTEIGWNTYDTCSRCDYTTYLEKKALGHDLVNHAAKAPTCTEIGWDAYQTCSRCDYTTYAELPALGHDYVAVTTKPSCTEKGYTTHTCARCKDSYRDAYVAALGHRYGAWIPNADGTNAADCLRGCGTVATVDCPVIRCILLADAAAPVELSLCPVCGEISEVDLLNAEGRIIETLGGTVLALVENTAAEALTERLPAGNLVLRMGTLESGETLLCVAFETGGELTQPSGQVKITLPAEVLQGHTLALIEEDGTEAELMFAVEEDEASFVLDFTDSLSPIRLIRLVPLA